VTFIDAPKFNNAPLIEVALSIQFDEKSAFVAAQVGKFWDLIRDSYPIAQEQPPLGQIEEVFGTSQVASFGFQFGNIGIRHWFLSRDGSSLVQLQKNRLALNWRKSLEKPQYVRYETLRGDFSELMRTTNSFFDSQNLGEIRSNICEASYINHFFFSGSQEFHKGLSEWLRFDIKNPSLLDMDSVNIAARYLVKNERGNPCGRLYIKVDPIVGFDGRNGINLELTCRVAVSDLSSEPELTALDLAHDRIVTTFSEITSDSAKGIWRGEVAI
jgi:uncharacterized protein (TIGR04255 family)